MLVKDTEKRLFYLDRCQICGLSDEDAEIEGSLLVGCDSCEAKFHNECYGIFSTEGEHFYCLACQAFGFEGPLSLRCSLCNLQGGILRPTTVTQRDYDEKLRQIEEFLSKATKQDLSQTLLEVNRDLRFLKDA